MPRPMDGAQQPQLGGGCTPDPWEGSSCFLLSLAEAVVLNMEAGGMVKLLFPTQVSSKRRAGGWGRCRMWQNQRAGDIMLSETGRPGRGQCERGEWRMGGSAGRVVPTGPLDAWHVGGRGRGPGGPSRLALVLGGWRDDPHRGGTPLLLGYRGPHQEWSGAPGSGCPGRGGGADIRQVGMGPPGMAWGLLHGKGLDARSAQNGQRRGCGQGPHLYFDKMRK